MPRPLQLVFLALLTTAIGSALWQHPHLPARVATHFDTTGQVNGWLARDTHTTLQIAALLFLTAVFQGIAATNRHLPRELINIPHRAYWLAPERAAATHRFISEIILQLGCTVLTFFIALFYFVYRANFLTPPRLTLHTWWLVGTLIAAVIALVTRLLLRLSRPPTA